MQGARQAPPAGLPSFADLLARSQPWSEAFIRETSATSAELLAQVYREIGALEPSRVETRSYTRWAELGPLALGLGLGLLGLELLLGFTLMRRYP